MNFDVDPLMASGTVISTLATVNVTGGAGISAEVNGTSVNLGTVGYWNTFVITSIDTTDPEFLNKTYKIEWTNPGGVSASGYQAGGYYLSYDGLTEHQNSNIGAGGPQWWWYSGYTLWAPYEGSPTTLNTPHSEVSYNEMLIQFTSYTSYRISIDGGTIWYNIASPIGTYPDTLLFKYKMYPGFTIPHSLIMKEILL